MSLNPSVPAGAMLQWQWSSFDELDTRTLYELLQLRCRVFILEQGPYLDPDGADLQSHHLCGRDQQGRMVAYLRVVHPGVKYDEPSIGRVVVHGDSRGTGAGRALIGEGVRRCLLLFPGQGIRISAQLHLEKLYRGFGFETVGEPYAEDDIPHVQMFRAPSMP